MFVIEELLHPNQALQLENLGEYLSATMEPTVHVCVYCGCTLEPTANAPVFFCDPCIKEIESSVTDHEDDDLPF